MFPSTRVKLNMKIVYKEDEQLNKSDMWIALAASVGVGAATFYTMSKSDKPLKNAIESMTPVLSDLTAEETNANQQQIQNQTIETMGPFGMS